MIRSAQQMTQHASLQDLGRFCEPALLVPVSLADGPKHGYPMAHIERISGQRPGPGTLCGAITRLETAKLIEPLRLRIAAGPTSSRRLAPESCAPDSRRCAHAGQVRLANA
jgi:hypothetical protein